MLFIVKHIYSSKEGGFSKNPSGHKMCQRKECRTTHLLKSTIPSNLIISDYPCHDKWLHYSENALACCTIIWIQYSEPRVSACMYNGFTIMTPQRMYCCEKRLHYYETVRTCVMVSL